MPTIWMAALGCVDPNQTGVLDEAPCGATLAASGAVDATWSADTALECEGFGPWSGDSIDLYFRQDFDALRVRLDYVHAGDQGTFDDAFVSFQHEGDEWGAYDDVTCTATLDRDEDIGEGEIGFRVWAVSGSVSCDAPLAPFQSQGTVDLGEATFEGWYQQAE